MNEQDLILRQKIEKREKFDIILAYILLVVLSGAIILVLYLKFIREEEPTTPEEYVPNYISLSEISSSLNTSLLANRYLNDGATFSTSVLDDSLVITYTKDDNNINLNIPVVGNELEVNISEENKDIVTDLYKEMAYIVCVYYGNQENYCRNTLNNIDSENSVQGIRFVNNDNFNTVYIDTTKGVVVNTEIVYNDVTRTSINDTNYILNLLDTKIYGININNAVTEIVFSGNIERLTEDNSSLSVVVKLYDVDGNLLGENKQEYNEDSPLGKVGTFEVSFMLSDTLKIESINSYSIEIVK